MPVVSLRTALAGLACTLASGLIGTTAATAHDAPMPNTARHGLLINERWVMAHWVPFDEREAERALDLAPGQLTAYLYNDHHTIAQLAAQRHVPFEGLVERLSAWTADAPAADKAVIEQRIRLVLVSGHLAQHLVGHVFHGVAYTTTLVNRSGLSSQAFADHRDHGWSYTKLIERNGVDMKPVEALLASRVAKNQTRGVTQGETPRSEADRLGERQSGRLHCWLTRPSQYLDPAAPYDRRYTKHDRGHTVADVPTNRSEQDVEDRLIADGLAGRPKSCWDLPAPFVGDPGAPLSRRALRKLARVPAGFKGPVNDAMDDMAHHDM